VESRFNELGDIFIFISGIILLLLGIIFFILYLRYKKKNHFLIFLTFLAAAAQLIVRKLDVLFPVDWESGLPNFLAGIFSLIVVVLILTIILFPDRVSKNFEEELIKANKNKEE